MRTGNCGRILLFCGIALTCAQCAGQLSKFFEDTASTVRYRKLVFSNTASTTNLTAFPVLIKLNSSRIDYSRMQSAGQDLRFFDSDGVTPLAYEIEKWDSSGESVVWVKVPQVDALSASDFIVMRYGDSTLGDGQSINSVWSNAFAGVWHFASGAKALKDSTANGNDATNFGSTEATGVAGYGRQMVNASSQYMRAPTAGISANTGTVEIWGNPASTDSLSQPRFLVAHWDGVGAERIYLMQRWNSQPTDFVTGLGSTGMPFKYSGVNFTVNSWLHCLMTWNGGAYNVYANGSLVDSGIYTGLATIQSFVYFGRISSSASFYWDGLLDEARFSNIARSADWVAAQYKSMNDTYITFGAEYN